MKFIVFFTFLAVLGTAFAVPASDFDESNPPEYNNNNFDNSTSGFGNTTSGASYYRDEDRNNDCKDGRQTGILKPITKLIGRLF